MKTYEGRLHLRWFKNDSYGDTRPLTLDLHKNETLSVALLEIKNNFMTKGENGKLPYSIKFDMRERK